MSEKVVITREQAEAIESKMFELNGNKAKIIKDHILDFYRDAFPLSNYEMGTEKLIKALYIGYEVEPEFKVGDWVIYQDHKHKKCVGEIIDIQYEHNRVQFYLTSNWRSIDDIIRHATSSEIAAEKERRWWKKHGRDVWELEDGDVIKKKADGFAFDVAVYGAECIKNNRERYDIVCFKENRLDVSE